MLILFLFSVWKRRSKNDNKRGNSYINFVQYEPQCEKVKNPRNNDLLDKNEKNSVIKNIPEFNSNENSLKLLYVSYLFNSIQQNNKKIFVYFNIVINIHEIT